MTDSMKFGPEWLRTLSESGPLGLSSPPNNTQHHPSNTSHAPTPCSIQSVRYTLAEHRYGREEMLALYSNSLTPPESLKSLTGLYVEKSQQPLALFSFSEDELRIWNRGVNPDGMGRGTGKQTDLSIRGRRDGPGREGRGRGRGGGTPGNYYPRSPGGPLSHVPYSGETGDASGEISPFNRSRPPFERQQSDRSWSERNGGGDGTARGGGRDMNWRRHDSRRLGDEEEGGTNTGPPPGVPINNPGWGRPLNKYQHQSRSWRDEDSWTDRDPRMSNHHLPEWAMEKNEGGGSFDASGAFHGHDQDDDISYNRRDSRHQKSKSESSDVGDGGGSDGSVDRLHDQQTSSSSDNNTNLGLDEIKKHVEKLERLSSADQQAMELSEIKRQLELLQKQQTAKLQPTESSPPPSKESSHEEEATDEVEEVNNQQVVEPSQPPVASPHPQIGSKEESGLQTSQANLITSSVEVVSQVSPIQVPIPAMQVPVVPVQVPESAPPMQVHQPLNSLARLHQTLPQSAPSQLNDSHLDDHGDNIATDLVSKLMEDEEMRDKQWYYKDPQQHVQGPFSCGEMAEWFQSGYFTLGLMVKRACDPSFSPLGELIKIWGCIPFLADQPGPHVMPPNMQEKELTQSPPQIPPHPNQVNQGGGAQNQQEFMMQFKMEQMRQQQKQLLLLQQQQQQQQQQQGLGGMAGRNLTKVAPSEWPDHLPPQENQQGGGQQSIQLRALIHHMQAKQQQQTSKVKEGSGGGAVMETLLSLHQQQVAQQAALQQLQQAAQLAEGATPAAASIRSLVSQMQQGKLRINNQQANIESVWNGGNSNWKQWSQLNPKAFKTEQQVLEEQMRAEDERKRDEMRKQDEGVRLSEDENKDNEDEKLNNERNKRESEEMNRRRMEEEQIRRKHEVVRRAEVERQRKEEEKRKKDEDKRRKEEDKRKHQEERERLKIEQERKQKEAEEAKKRADLMSKIQRAQWCPPQASNTSLLDIQRSEREQQLMRSMQQEAQQAAQQAAQRAEQEAKNSMHLKWTETSRNTPYMAESLADIQAQQYRQLLKMHEKEKAEREKKEAQQVSQQVVSQHNSGTWSQGLNWGSLPDHQPVWHSQGGGGSVGFWDQLTGPKLPQQNLTKPQQPPKTAQQAAKEKSKSKREEMAVMQLFGGSQRQDEFTQWCQQTLSNLTMSCPVDIPTFVTFLRDIESGPDVIEYVRSYVGESKEATEFARQFLDRRHSLSTGQQGNIQQYQQIQQHHHQMSEDFQQVKAKGKNKKKSRVTKAVDPRILGFSSTASPDRFNVGDREYPEDL